MDKEKEKSQNALREEEILKFWQENKIFEKSLEKESPKGKYVFYDGPPFATGLPHYGHILGSTVKDVIGRYKTMSGFNVPRRWGWDCHGLPIENIVEKDLGISGKKAIEELGIDKFTEHARSKVLTYVSEWKKTIDRMGRWVDFDNSYKTMDNTFIESVWWALGEMNNKGLLYEGVRVLAYCPRCETPIANSEIAMDNSYKDITDISVYAKFKLYPGQKYGIGKETKDSAYLLAWTTTPWTLPGNTAIAIHKDIVYSAIRVKGTPELLIVANESIENVFKDKEIEIIHDDIKGADLVGLSYEPIFNYYKNIDLPNKENIWKVWHADFVTLDKGTGIAHEAPAFGEDDMNLAKEHNIPFIRHVEPNGVFSKEVLDFPDTKVKPKEDHQSTDILIIKHLAHTGSLFAKEKIIHSYPHCYRCETPLLYYALPSWFINIQKVKNDLLKKGEDMNWIPSHLKEGRFKNTMESAPDWTISRNRYWASPLPIWKNKNGEIMMINSIEDLKSKTKKSGNKYFVMRHGEAENNKSNICSGKNHSHSLTEKGREQVRINAEMLKDKKIDIIFVSPYKRTQETAEEVIKVLNFNKENVISDDRIEEINVGVFNGRPIEDYYLFYKEDRHCKYDKAPEEGESIVDVKKRTGDFIYDIDNKYSNKNILIVSHDDASWALFSSALALNKEETFAIDDHGTFIKNAEIKELEFVPLPHNHNYELDLHRPYIDSIILVDDKGQEYKRIPEVIDCWFESGSMPFAQDHFPFENPNWRTENFPSGFVAEYIAQTRTWFYYTHAISTILFGDAPFENVVTTGTVLALDGSKMSKSKNNYPDPWSLFDMYGADALRFYLVSSTLMKGEDVNFDEKTVAELNNKVFNLLYNVLTFYELYRDKEVENSKEKVVSMNILDKWIIARLNNLTIDVTKELDDYKLLEPSRAIRVFIDELSTWYVRRSRERLKDGEKEAKQTLYFVLKNLAKLMAPFAPFTAEDIWQKLKNDTDEESVHLSDWPKISKPGLDILEIDNDVINEMKELREVVTLGLQARQKAGIPVRQPLNKLYLKNNDFTVSDSWSVYLDIILDELNIKNIDFQKEETGEDLVILDTEITFELKQEGIYRELVRAIQDMRKKKGLSPNDVVSLSVATSVDGQEIINKFKIELLKTVGAKDLSMKENDGEAKFNEIKSPDASEEAFREVKIGDLTFIINLVK